MSDEHLENNVESNVDLLEEENSILLQCYYLDRDYSNPLLPRDKRQKSKLARLIAQREEIFARHKIELVPVRVRGKRIRPLGENN